MTMKACIAAVVVAITLAGCVSKAGDVDVTPLQTVDKGERVVTFLSDTPYLADFTIALAKQGFQVKPMPSQQRVKETDGDKTTEYRQASAQFGLTLASKQTGVVCVFTANRFYDFTMMLVDIKANQTVLIVRQNGPDGPCDPVQPVFDTMAAALAKNW